MKKTKRWRDSNPFSQPPGGEKGVPGVLHQPIYQAYKGGLKLGLTRPITASTGACAACSKLYQVVVGSRLASPFSFSHIDVPLHHSDLLFSISSLRYIIYELKGVFFTCIQIGLVAPVQMCRGKSYVVAKRRTRRLRLKKEGLAGREHTTY